MRVDICSQFGNNRVVENFGVEEHIAMRVIGIERLLVFYGKYPNCKKWSDCWLADMRGMSSPFLPVILQRYPTIEQSSTGNFLIFRFQIDEVQYFMKVQVAEGAGVLTVRWVGPAVEYFSYMEEVDHGN